MTRSDINAAMQLALGGDSLSVLPLVELDMINDPAHVWGGIGDLSWNGKTWQGVGNLGEVGSIQADTKGTVPSLELSLLGIEPDVLAVATQQQYRGRSGRVWLACFDEDMKLIGDPALYFAGEISSMTLEDTYDRRIRVLIDSRMAILRQNRPRYRTDEDQQRRHPGDKFFEFMPAVVSKTIYWGLKGAAGGSIGRSGSGGSEEGSGAGDGRYFTANY